MKLIPRDAPHIRHSDSNKTMMGDMILTLLPFYLIGVCFYGLRVVLLMLLSAAVCWLADLVCCLVRGRRFNVRDLSSLVTGLLIPLLMPATISYGVVVLACIFAIVVVKHPFGGIGENLFNPAAGGVAFAIACWPEKMFAYPNIFATIPLGGVSGVATVSSTAYTLKMGGVPGADLGDVLLGLTPGPVGAASILVVLACLLYLAYRRTVPLIQPVCFLAAAALMAFLFPRADIGRTYSVAYELMSGSLVFGGVFLLSDPVTSPKRFGARALYGLTAGVLVMVFRRFGGFEQGVTFAVLLMNAVSEEYDRLVQYLAARAERERRAPHETCEE